MATEQGTIDLTGGDEPGIQIRLKKVRAPRTKGIPEFTLSAIEEASRREEDDPGEDPQLSDYESADEHNESMVDFFENAAVTESQGSSPQALHKGSPTELLIGLKIDDYFLTVFNRVWSMPESGIPGFYEKRIQTYAKQVERLRKLSSKLEKVFKKKEPKGSNVNRPELPINLTDY